MADSSERVHSIKSPLPPGENGEPSLEFRFMRAREQISGLFEYDVQLVSHRDDIDPNELLGKSMTISVRMPSEDRVRHYNGIVASFYYQGRAEGYSQYQAILRPWLWLLSRNSDCRIFQEVSVPEIFDKVCKETHGLSDFRRSLTSQYRKRDYCVQYRETDCDFLNRLLQEEGIFYYFDHSEDKHTLVLADSNTSFPNVDGPVEAPFRAPGEARVSLEHVSAWRVGHDVQTGSYVHDDYDFTKPRVELEGRASITRQHAKADYETYDYPGLHWEAKDGEDLAKVRIQEVHAKHHRCHGLSDHRGLAPGHVFKLTEHPRDSENQEYVVVAMTTEIDSAEIEHMRADAQNRFDVSFEAILKSEPYRPQRETLKPHVRGPQTAVVVGKRGEEIWTDKYGRVKVQFHWDREGKNDENSSCWVRVSQLWAGKKWGGMHLPRIGQEVVVDFLEGDPDRPLITGRVYNDAQMPPYTLPDDQTQSGIKSRTTKEGTPDNFNELRFEDKKGEEQIYLHAEKDFERVVENNDKLTVGKDKQDPGKQEITVYGDRTATIETGNDAITVSQGNHKIDVSQGSSTIKAAKKVTLEVGDSTVTVEPSKITLANGASSVTVESAKISLNSAQVAIAATGNVTINGMLVKIN